jgi:hypothetical protein
MLLIRQQTDGLFLSFPLVSQGNEITPLGLAQANRFATAEKSKAQNSS